MTQREKSYCDKKDYSTHFYLMWFDDSSAELFIIKFIISKITLNVAILDEFGRMESIA